MFAKIAHYKIPHFNVTGILGSAQAAERRRAKVAPIGFACANDNRRDRGVVARNARPRLTSHWQVNAATGRLECHWVAESDDGAGTELPGPSGPRGLVDRAAPMLLSA